MVMIGLQAKKLDTLREQADAGAQHVEGNELINQEALNIAITATDGGRNIPPHDLAATTPQAAYPLDKIIAKGEWDYLSDIFDVLEAGESIPLDVFPSFVCNRTYKLADIKVIPIIVFTFHHKFFTLLNFIF